MNEPPAPSILPPTNQPPVYGPVYSPGNTTKRNMPTSLIILVIGLLAIVIAGSVLITGNRPKKLSSGPVSSPTVTPNPTPVKTPSSFATQSAFLQFKSAVDTLPVTISGTTISDQALNPPSVDLSLGFPK
jgi:hypothetical protein